MSKRARLHTILGTVVLLAMSTLGVSAPAAAADRSGDDSAEIIAHALEAEPGGIVLSDNVVYWPRLTMTLTVDTERSAALRAVGSCPSGLYCAYSGQNLTGSRLSWTACGVQSTAALSVVRSIANARLVGVVQARNGTSVLASASSNAWTNVGGTTTNLNCLN